MDNFAIKEVPSAVGTSAGHAALAPRPRNIAETGLSQSFLSELVAKHLYYGGVLDQQHLTERTALAWPILENLLGYLRAGAYVEIRGGGEGVTALRYALTERGRNLALDALMKSGYAGPAPVPVELYSEVTRAQSVHNQLVMRAGMHEAFANVVVREEVLNQLGPALHSGRPIFIYGPPGTGKSYIGQRLRRLLGGSVLIPFALAAGDHVIQLFDPALHHPINGDLDKPSFRLEDGYDPRFVRCERPTALTGGELTLDMLEMSYDLASKQYYAPLQLKANNGIYIIDDLGRQRVAVEDLLNRWIVPLEEKRDYYTLGSGKRFSTPFDVILIFSTNLNPLDLADEAFLRRLGYKVRFDTLTGGEYEAIWRQVCEQRGISF
ncbi:MAG: AAA family ATPase, partial [Pseudomonadota bacterium]